jgi:transcriptional regulator with GAF, ATPase, and Fis domain
MADEKPKTTYIVTSRHVIIGHTGAPSETLAPGGRVVFDEEAGSHKFLRAQIEAGNPDYAHLSIVEVDREAEAKQSEEREKLLAKAEEIAAEQRQEEARALQERQEALRAEPLEGQSSAISETAFPPQDVEAQSLAEQSGAGQRATTQADVVEEDSSKSARRSSRGPKG